MAMDEFNDMIGKQGYSEEQLNMCRDIRKRGKNKVRQYNNNNKNKVGIMMIMLVVLVMMKIEVGNIVMMMVNGAKNTFVL